MSDITPPALPETDTLSAPAERRRRSGGRGAERQRELQTYGQPLCG